MNKKTQLAIEIIRGNICVECGNIANENLRKWFKDKWVNIGKKDKSGKHPPCGTSGDKRAYAKCVPASKARSCLLYTSPSPRDATLSRMPSSA